MNPVIKDGTKTWLNKEGQLHRTDGPAFEYAINEYGTKTWLNKKGQLHRTDGPAVEYPDGDKFWYLNGVRHRTDGPAVEWADGDKFWYLNGPAIECADGYKEWFLNGTRLTKDLFLKLTLGPVKKLPLYLGMGFDQYISERLQHESSH